MRKPFVFVFFVILCISVSYVGYAQGTFPVPLPSNTSDAPQTILDVRIEGNEQIKTGDIIRIITTRPGRPFSATALEEDVRTLVQRRWFIDVRPTVERTPEGYIVTFTCVERQLIRYIRVTGNQKHTIKTLLEEANIKEGDALDPIAIHQAKERMTQFYRESGFHQVHIRVLRGDEPGDRGVVFSISEGPQQRILSVEFQGNRIASGERLKTQIESKPGRFFWINSEFTRKKLDEDVETLINYYRKLGFFYAKVDRIFEETNGYTGLGQNRGWVKVKFIIDEGPRCKIRNIRFVGNNVFSDEELLKIMKLARSNNQFYNQDTLEVDMQAIKEKYGNQGYVFAMPAPDPRVDKDFVDLVVNIREGPRCYLETLSIEIKGNEGAESYTKWHPALNRISLRPGDILRTSEINDSRRRLMGSALFNTNPMQGSIPEFDFDLPKEALEMEAAFQKEREKEAEKAEQQQMASGDPQIRGQAPVFFNPNFLPLTQPVIRLTPKNRTHVPTTPQTAPQQANGVYRGQSPAGANPSLVYAPPPHQETPAPISVPNNTQQQNWGSLAPSTAPLQTSNTAAATGMFPTQFQPGAADTSSILRANPYDSLYAPSNVPPMPSGVQYDPNVPPGVSPYIYGVRGRWILQETRTGTLMASLAISSDAGLMGRFVFEEQNFDITNVPRGFRLSDWTNAFRGRGQRFRIEAVPGTQVQRYSAMWETPYWFNLDYSFGVNGSYYQRYYNEWYEDRIGGGISFGKFWTPDISTRVKLGGQEVNVYRTMIMPSNEIGRHPMYNIGLDAIYNTRDSEYMPTEGHLIMAGVEQILGDFQFVRGNIDLRKYFMLRERPDRSGRWVLGLRSSLSVTESGSTPTFERYFGGGFTNLRGFEFRGVSPRTDNGTVMGGNMEFYNSAELIFPLTADDMVRGSVFIDTGTVETSFSKWEDKYRVAVGFGLRLTIPMMGPAPIALDFAFPLNSSRWDDKQVFSFGMALMR